MSGFEGPFLHGQSPLEAQARGDQFPNVLEVEDRIRKEAKETVDRLERGINLAQRVLTLKSAPGFQQLVESIANLETHAKRQMVGAEQVTDSELRILQGRCQAFGSILAIMRKAEQHVENLAQQLAHAKERAAKTIRPDGKVVPDTLVGDFS
jgi:hypothetical protein